MGPDSNAPLPGSMTVPPLYGWVGILLLLTVAIVVGLCFLLIGATSRSATRSSEWQAWLDARSRGRTDGADGSPQPGGPVSGDVPDGPAPLVGTSSDR